MIAALPEILGSVPSTRSRQHTITFNFSPRVLTPSSGLIAPACMQGTARCKVTHRTRSKQPDLIKEHCQCNGNCVLRRRYQISSCFFLFCWNHLAFSQLGQDLQNTMLIVMSSNVVFYWRYFLFSTSRQWCYYKSVLSFDYHGQFLFNSVSGYKSVSNDGLLLLLSTVILSLFLGYFPV